MIPDSGQEGDNSKEAMGLTRLKRDEFLVEIRKKKSHNIVNEKRMKVTQGNVSLQEYTFMALNGMQEQNMNNKDQNNANSLENMSEYEIQTKIQELKEKFLEIFNAKNWEELVMIIQCFRVAVGERNSWLNGKKVIEMDVVPHILYLLSDQFSSISRMQAEASLLIANLTAGDTEDNAYLVHHGCIHTLRECLKANYEAVQENALWALMNLAWEREIDFRQMLLEEEVLNELVRQLNKKSKSVVYSRTAATFISHIMKKPYPPFDKVTPCIGTLSQLLAFPDAETKKQVLLSLSFFSDFDEYARFDVILGHQIIPKIVKFIGNESFELTHYALKTAGNLSLGHERINLKLCQSDILQALANVLQFKDNDIRREACFTLSNILTDNTNEHDVVVEKKLMPILLEIMKNDYTEIKLDATMCVFNYMDKCSPKGVQELVSLNLIEILLENMATSNDPRLIIKSIHVLGMVLKFGVPMEEGAYNGTNPYATRVIVLEEGTRILENLQSHPNKDIYAEVSQLLDTYFQTFQMEISQ